MHHLGRHLHHCLPMLPSAKFMSASAHMPFSHCWYLRMLWYHMDTAGKLEPYSVSAWGDVGDKHAIDSML